LNKLLSAALNLAGDGWKVFPLAGKIPLPGTRGFHDATDDQEAIRAMNWEEADSIGGALPDGVFAVDVDVRSNGEATMKALTKAGRTFPATRTHQTGGGGTHRFYRLPAKLEGRKVRGTLGPGIDIKSAGKGYVVLPPSPGYKVRFGREIEAAPDWMIEELVAPEADERPASAGSAPKFFEAFQGGTSYGQAALEREIGRLMSQEEGGRNNALNRAAFAMAQLVAGGELPEDETREKLELAGDRMGLTRREIGITVASGWKAGLAEPREAPEEGPERATKAFEGFQPTSDEGEFFWLDWENADLTPPPFYLRPIIPKNAYVTVYGPTASSKSMVFVGLAAWGSREIELRTSVYSLENPAHIDILRVKKFDPDPDLFRITNAMVDLNDNAQLKALVEREQAFQPDWIILDTYSHVFSSRTEDGNAKAIEFARRMRYVMAELGCTVIYLDHTGYQDHGEPRDASAKRQQVDVAIKMNAPQVPWEPNRSAIFHMENHKASRFGNPFDESGRIEDTPDKKGLKIIWNSPPGKRPTWEAK
jgi:putative DNA primase/helicase